VFKKKQPNNNPHDAYRLGPISAYSVEVHLMPPSRIVMICPRPQLKW
jgi:hypothetical protein